MRVAELIEDLEDMRMLGRYVVRTPERSAIATSEIIKELRKLPGDIPVVKFERRVNQHIIDVDIVLDNRLEEPIPDARQWAMQYWVGKHRRETGGTS